VTVVGENLGTTPTRPGAAPRRGTVELRGQFASGTPLVVHGKVGSYPGPLFLDVVVELTDFPVPRLNPYLDRLSSYVAKQGTLTATLSYRVNDDDLDALNDVRIDGLDLAPGGRGGEFRKRTGLPLDTLVSLLKDRKGVIKLNVPVHGQLSSPEFEYGEAVWAALRNLTIRLVALPFSLVGKLFFTDDSRIESVQIDPVTFQTAKPVPDKAGAEQIARLATFLKDTPEVRLRLRPVTTVADVNALRREALESRLATLGADEAARRQAAVGLYTELFPRREPPTSDEALYEALTRETPTPPRALRALADGRVAAVQNALVGAGIPADRLERLESRTAVESEGAARVEFEMGEPRS
jgi:outer membrane protein OmpA-like peptidoglycan-associated protein